MRLGETVLTYNSHYLFDAFDNVTFGYINLVQPSAPGEGISQRDSRSRGLALDRWSAGECGRLPPGCLVDERSRDPPQADASGPYSTTIRVDYPTDPEWPAGTVTKGVSLRFDVGTFHFMEYFSNWDLPGRTTAVLCVAFDPSGPWTVSPGAEGDACRSPEQLG